MEQCADELGLENSLKLPMTVLIDYRGFRLLAISLLPIQKDTIIYGKTLQIIISYPIPTIF